VDFAVSVQFLGFSIHFKWQTVRKSSLTVIKFCYFAYLLFLTTLCVIVIRWAPAVQNIFYQGSKRKLVPGNQNQEKLLHFFNCAATMMTEQLQNLALDSASDFTDLLIQPLVVVLLITLSPVAIFL